MTEGAPGVVFLNNTILTEFAAGTSGNLHMFNNLILGENALPAIFSVNTYTSYSESDYNGFRPNPGAEFSFQWSSPPWNIPADYPTRFLTPNTIVRSYGNKTTPRAEPVQPLGAVMDELLAGQDAFDRLRKQYEGK